MTRPGGYAATAAEFLDEAAAADTGSLRDLVLRHLAAMQGIGWALIAVREQLADHAEAATASSDHLECIAGLASELADGDHRATSPALGPRDLVTVRQALEDAAAWRAMRSEGAGCGDCVRLWPDRCADHGRDNGLAAAYETLSARLPGGEQG